MQMMMNMATRSFKSTSGSVSVALVLVLVAVMVAETSAQLVNITFVNELNVTLSVILPATALGPSETIPVAARSDSTVKLSAQASVLDSNFYFEVRGCRYATAGSVLERAVSETGTFKVYLTGHCGTGVAGLQYVTSIAGNVCANFGCAAPVDSNCTGPIS